MHRDYVGKNLGWIAATEHRNKVFVLILNITQKYAGCMISLGSDSPFIGHHENYPNDLLVPYYSKSLRSLFYR